MFDSVFANIIFLVIVFAAFSIFIISILNTAFHSWGEFFSAFTIKGQKLRHLSRVARKESNRKEEQDRLARISMAPYYASIYANADRRHPRRRQH